jgi:fibronectin type 3 domain-containing protein
MMKKYLSFFAVIFCVVFVACNNAMEGVVPESLPVEEADLFAQNEYNSDLRDFALAVSSAMNQSTEFRQLIKGQALAKVDGDYDVLLRHIKNKPLAPVDGALLRSGGSYTVKDLLESSYAPNELRSTAASIIEELSEKYPDLQVSIPVHAEDWDESTVPVVAFIPYEYEDMVTQTVAGYTSNGSITPIDAIMPPDGPVIVVGQNERPILRDPVPLNPAPPTNLTATQTQSGIGLQWEYSPESSVVGYKIYRKGEYESTYSLHLINNGRLNASANDINCTYGAKYWYYVTAYNNNGESLSSNIASATAPGPPDGPTSFSAILNTNQEVELRWTIPPGTSYIETLDLYRYVLNQTNGYQLYQQFNTNQNKFYFDHNVIQGQTMRYMLQIANAIGTSNPLYDMVKIPYRNPAEKSPVHIKHIKCSHDLEGWLKGDPEIIVSVYCADAAGTTKEVTKVMLGVNGCDSNFDTKLFEWQPNIWYEVYTLHVVESDGDQGSVSIDITAKVGVKYKTSNSVELGAEPALSAQFSFRGPEDCGGADLSFYDPINTTLQFRGREEKYWCNVTLGQ